MEFKSMVYHPLIEQDDSRLTSQWSPRAIAQANFSSLFIRTYFKDIQISINQYSLFSHLKYIEHFLKNSIERGLL